MSRNDRTDKSALLGNGTIGLAVGLSFMLAACSTPGIKSPGDECVGSNKLPQTVVPKVFTTAVAGNIEHYGNVPTEGLSADHPELFAPASHTLQRVDISFGGLGAVPVPWGEALKWRPFTLIGNDHSEIQSSLLSLEIVWQAPTLFGDGFVAVECHYHTESDDVIAKNVENEILDMRNYPEHSGFSPVSAVANFKPVHYFSFGGKCSNQQSHLHALQPHWQHKSVRLSQYLALNVPPEIPLDIDERELIGFSNPAFLSGSPPRYFLIG